VLTGALFLGAAGAVLAPAGPGALLPLKMAIASADSVGNDVYVAVVVDFGSGSSLSTISKCVPVASTDRDSDALAAAVGASNVSYNNSGLLCAIANYPTNGVQNCGQNVGPGDYDYWSYWHGTSGSWVYANNGPAEQSVASPADDVEGWRFQSDEPDNPSGPPPATPATYAQICNATTEVAPSQPPSSAVTTTTPTSMPPAVTTTTTDGTATAPDHASTTTTPSTRPTSAVAAPTAAAPTAASTTSTTQPGSQGETRGSGEVSPGAPHHALAGSTPRQNPGGSGSTLLPVVLVAAVVAALGGIAVVRWRRRPADE